MKAFYYLGVFLFGFLGILGVLRNAELLFVGKGISPASLLISLVFLLLAKASLTKARNQTPPAPR